MIKLKTNLSSADNRNNTLPTPNADFLGCQDFSAVYLLATGKL
jgi:hypothetical protein